MFRVKLFATNVPVIWILLNFKLIFCDLFLWLNFLFDHLRCLRMKNVGSSLIGEWIKSKMNMYQLHAWRMHAWRMRTWRYATNRHSCVIGVVLAAAAGLDLNIIQEFICVMRDIWTRVDTDLALIRTSTQRSGQVRSDQRL